MRKTGKRKRILAFLLTAVLLIQNVQVLMAGTTSEELDARVGLETHMDTTEENTEEADTNNAKDPNPNTEELNGDSIEDEFISNEENNSEDNTSGSGTTGETSAANDVSASVYQEVYQQESDGYVYNYVQMTANVTNNDTENAASGVDVKVLLPAELSYVTNGETAGMSGFNSPQEAVDYGYDLDEVSDITPYSGQVIMWCDQTIDAGQTATYTFTTQLQDGITDVSGINSAWYVGGNACSYSWINTEVLIPPVQEEQGGEQEPTEPQEPAPQEQEPTPTEPAVEEEPTPAPTLTSVPTSTPTPSPEPTVAPTLTPKQETNQLRIQQRKFTTFGLQGFSDRSTLAAGNDSEGQQANAKNILADGNEITIKFIVNNVEVQLPDPDFVLNRDDKIHLELTYKYSDDNKPTPADSVRYYDLPAIGWKYVNQSGEITDLLQRTAGRFEIEDIEEGAKKRVYFYYDETFLNDHPNNIRGTFDLSMEIDKSHAADKDEITVNFPGMGGDYTVNLNHSNLKGEKYYDKVEGQEIPAQDENGYFTYHIKLEPETGDVKNVVVTDIISDNLSFVQGSFVATTFNGDNVDLEEVEIDKDQPQKVTIKIADIPYGEGCIITYKAQLKSGVTDFNFDNKATWTWEGSKTEGHAESSTNIKSEILAKKATVIGNQNQIEYTIEVNKLKADLIPGDGYEIEEITLIDVIDEQVALLRDTIKIQDEDGNALAGSGHDYDSNTRTLTITIPDETYAKITYSVRVKGEIGKTYTIRNNVSMEGKAGTESGTEDDIEIQRASATVTGDKGTITLIKTGRYSIGGKTPYLQGVEFQLYNVNLEDANVTLVESHTTDKDGMIVFGAEKGKSLSKNTLYYFQETKTIEPYIVDNTKRYFVIEPTDDFKSKVQDKWSEIAGQGVKYEVSYLTDGEVLEPITNDKEPDPVDFRFKAEKTIAGVTPANEEKFTFKLERTSETGPVPESTTVTNNGGMVEFPRLTFTKAGTYRYEISEVAGHDSSYVYDSTIYVATVNVVKGNTTGNLEIKKVTYTKKGNTTPINDVVFDNQKATGFSLKKKTAGVVNEDTEFTFEVTGTYNGKAIDYSKVTVSGNTEVINNNNSIKVTVTVPKDASESGNVTFTGIPVGTEIRVSEEGKAGWSIVEAQSKLELELAEDASNEIIVTNQYKASSSWTPEAAKELTGRPFTTGEEFKFIVTEEKGGQKETVSEGTADKNGAITFKEIKYSKESVGTHTYTIQEVIPDKAELGLTYDQTFYTIAVEVSDPGTGTLSVEPGQYKMNGNTAVAPADVKFKNTYTASGEWTPEGTKKLTGTEYKGTTFKFVVLEGTEEVSTGTASEDGKITFTPIPYTQRQVGTHTYTIKETKGDREDIAYDTTEYSVIVKVTDIGDGRLAAKAGEYTSNEKTSDVAAFTNTYQAKTKWSPKADKILTGRDFKDGEKFTFIVADDNKNMVSKGEVSEGKNGIAKAIIFKDIEYTQEDIGRTYTYTISEEPVGGGISPDKTKYKVDVTIDKDSDGNLKAIPGKYYVVNGDGTVDETQGFDKPTFKNTYKATGEWTPVGKKTLEGRDNQAGEFTFNMVEIKGGKEVPVQSEPIVSEAGKNGTGAKINFPAIKYGIEDAGTTHYYKITEIQGDKKGVVYDSTVYLYSVSVEDKGNGNLDVKAICTNQSGSEANFKNTYTASGSWIPKGSKTLTGREYKQGEKFEYSVKENGKVESTGWNTENGTITFEPITYSLKDKGEHTYKITENKGTDDGIDYDDTEYTVIVNVEDDGKGKLIATIKSTYTANGMEFEEAKFTNTYSAEASWTPTGTKTLTGRDYIQGETFQYVVMEGDTKVSEGKSGADGRIKFDSVKYYKNDVQDDTGVHTYVISEVKGDNDAITYDTKTWTVKVNVTDEGNGTLKATPASDNPEVEFTNVYKAQGSWTPEADKKLEGRNYLENETFTYVVKEGDEVVSRGSNTADGKITFDTILYDETSVREHTYTMSEVKGDDEGLTYDDTVYEITVNVKDDGYGKLTSSVVFITSVVNPHSSVESITFKNVYTADGTWRPIGTKTLTGREYRENEVFKYVIKDEDNNIVSNGSNTKNGSIEFEEIKYELKDVGKTYKYTISEVPGTDVGTDYDPTSYEAVVKITDGGNGKLKVDPTYTQGQPMFNNTYGAIGYWKPEGTKELTGRDYQPGETFYYRVQDVEKDEVVSTGWNLKNGKITFSRVDYDQDDIGDHTYEISEVTKDTAGTAYDTRTFAVKVKVEDAGRGKLKVTEEYPEGGVVFKNKGIQFNVNKVELGSDKEVAGAELTVYGKDANGDFTEVIDTWISKEGETHNFGEKLNVDREYLLRETVAPSGYFATRDISFRVEKDGSITTTAEHTEDENGNVTYLVKDTKNGIYVSKRAITGEEEVSGAVLRIMKGIEEVARWTSGTKPYYTDGKLEIGETYILQEVSAPAGYLLAEDISFKVEADGTISAVDDKDADAISESKTTLIMRDQPKDLTISKVDESGKPLSGAKLQILDKDGNVVEEAWETTDTLHEVKAKLIPNETYILRELEAPTGYTIAADQEFKVDDKTESVTVTMKDTPTRVAVSKKAITGEDNLDGATLRIVDASGTVVVKDWTTKAEEDEEIVAKLNVNTPYILEEVTPPAGYAKAANITFMLNDRGEILINNEKAEAVVMRDAKTRIKVSKMDITGEAELVGAVLQILDKEDNRKVVAEWTTTDKPHYIEGLTVGKTYLLHEKLAPDGYAYAKDVEFVVKEDSIEGNEQKITMYDEKNVVLITKTDLSGTKELPGAKLQLIQIVNGAEKVLEAWTSTNTEYKVTSKLEAGVNYILREIDAPDGYTLAEDVKFTVNRDGTPTRVVMKDAPTEVKILKTDENGKALSGATLVVKDSSGKEIDRWVSDEEAHTIKAILVAGAEYTLSEASAPNGYTLAENIKFTVPKDGEVINVTMKNYREKGNGRITVTKMLSVITGTEEMPLKAKDDTFYVNLFTDAQGKKPYRGMGPTAIRFINSSVETVTFEDLPKGTYYVFETDAAGNVINLDTLLQHNGKDFMCTVESGTNTVTLDLEAGKKEGVVNLKNTFYELPDGYSYEAEISINKQVLKGDSATTVNDVFYAGIFTKDSDGIYNLYETVELKQNGTVTVKVPLGGENGDEPITYYILETDANGDVIDLDVFEYEVSGEGTVSLDTTNTSGKITIVNKVPETKKGKLIIQKIDGSGVGLAGAHFQIKAEDGSVVGEWTSKTSAYEISLKPGKYVMKELEAPAGYKGSGDVSITVDEDYEITVESSGEYSFNGSVLKYVNRKQKNLQSTSSSGGTVTTSTTGARTINTLSGKAAVKTGDETPISMYVLLLALAALAATGTVAYKKRKKVK